jgi:holo-[acyl-carrier protein] synthase
MGQDVIHHGVDIVDIDRIAQAVTRWGNSFLQRVFTPQELVDAHGRASSLAARFAAKEATAKALGAGIQGIGAGPAAGIVAVGWRDIEVVRTPTGQPVLHLQGRAADRAAVLGWRSVSLSLSHARDAAIASVVAIAAPGPDPSGAAESRMVE